MALGNKFLSPTCAPDLGDIDTYFFLKKCFDLTSEYVLQWRHFLGDLMSTEIQKVPKDPILFPKKKVGVFVTTQRNFLRMRLISFDRAAKL